MRTKLVEKNVKVRVDEKNKLTSINISWVLKIQLPIKLDKSFLEKIIDTKHKKIEIVDLENNLTEYRIYFSSKGNSKCSDQDIYDENTGYKIAESKACLNGFIKERQILVNIYSSIYSGELSIEEQVDRLDNSMRSEEYHLLTLMGYKPEDLMKEEESTKVD